MDEELSGTVKWFNDDKGFGFIVRDDGERDVFVHHTAIQMQGRRKLVEGQRVTFELGQSEKGLEAARVTKIDVPRSPIADVGETPYATGPDHSAVL